MHEGSKNFEAQSESEIDYSSKSLEELQKMKGDQDFGSEESDINPAKEAPIVEQKEINTTQPERTDRQKALEEIDTTLAIPLDQIPDDELVDHGNYLIKQMDYARVTKQGDLLKRLNERLQAVKEEEASLHEPVTETKEKPIGSLGSRRGPKNAKHTQNDEYRSSWSGRTAKPATRLGSHIGSEESSEEVKSGPEFQENFAKELEEQSTAEKVTSSKEESESKRDLDIPPREWIEETTKDLSPEEAQAVTAVMQDKEKWYQVLRSKVFGDLTGKEILENIAVGAVIGTGVKTAARAAFGMSGGAAVGAAAGALSAVGKEHYNAWKKRGHYTEAEEMLAENKVGEVYEKIKSGKLKKLDALQLLAEEKERLIATNDTVRFMEMLDVEAALIQREEEFSGLKGGERLKRYMELTSSMSVSGDKKMLQERERELKQLSTELAELGGREVSWAKFTRAAIVGAAAGAFGSTVVQHAEHYVGSFWSNHFGHHDLPTTEHVASGSIVSGAKPTNINAPHLYPEHAQVNTHLGPEASTQSHQVEAPHAVSGLDQTSDLKVKGTVWSTVKNFFKAKGINASNDEINTAVRGLAHENHIGIAADHPAAGSYNVLDTQVPDGTVLHGVDKFIPHHSAGAANVHTPEIHKVGLYDNNRYAPKLPGVTPAHWWSDTMAAEHVASGASKGTSTVGESAMLKWILAPVAVIGLGYGASKGINKFRKASVGARPKVKGEEEATQSEAEEEVPVSNDEEAVSHKNQEELGFEARKQEFFKQLSRLSIEKRRQALLDILYPPSEIPFNLLRSYTLTSLKNGTYRNVVKELVQAWEAASHPSGERMRQMIEVFGEGLQTLGSPEAALAAKEFRTRIEVLKTSHSPL